MSPKTMTNLLFVLAVVANAALIASCKAKCLHGYVMEGTSCKKITSDAGNASDAGDAERDAETTTSTETPINTRNVGKTEVDAATSTDPEPKAPSDAGTRPSSDMQSRDAGDRATGSSSSPNQVEPESCDVEGATRCSAPTAQRNRQVCQSKVWVANVPCAASETCVTQQDGATCAPIEQLCIGTGGTPVCSDQGAMLLCNGDGTVQSQEMCAGRDFLCSIGGSPRRVIPFGASTKTGQSQHVLERRVHMHTSMRQALR